MTAIDAAAVETAADITWREWRARGDEADRRRTVMMVTLTTFAAVCLAIVLLVQLI